MFDVLSVQSAQSQGKGDNRKEEEYRSAHGVRPKVDRGGLAEILRPALTNLGVALRKFSVCMEDFSPPGVTPWAAKHGAVARSVGAVLTGVVAGPFLVNAIGAGAGLLFREKGWGVAAWGEHWAVRVVASWVATAGAGYVTGLVSRRWGAVLATASALPLVAGWLFTAGLAWGWWQHMLHLVSQLSVGNRAAVIVLSISTLPISAAAGLAGVADSREFAHHFDSRRHSLLGVPWYHYLWLPFLLHLAVMQTSAVALYGFGWLREVFRSDLSIFSIGPIIFVGAIWATLRISVGGITKACEYLADLKKAPAGRSKAFLVFKNGFILPAIAGLLQIGIFWIHGLLLSALKGK